MFKNLILYTLGTAPASFDGLAPFTECLPTQDQSSGFVPPRAEHGALAEHINGHTLLRFKTESRMLPASVVRREAEKRMAKIEEVTGRKPGKKQAREIREDTYIQLLPQAFTRQESFWVWIDPKSRLLAIDCGTTAKAELVLTQLFKGVPGLTAVPLTTHSSPAASMAMWLSGQGDPGEFDVDRECELTSTDDQQATVKYARHHLDIAEVRAHVQNGKVPKRLAMAFEGRVSFTLTDGLHLKKIRFLEGVFSNDIEEADRFDADTAIATGEMERVIAGLVGVLGGVAT